MKFKNPLTFMFFILIRAKNVVIGFTMMSFFFFSNTICVCTRSQINLLVICFSQLNVIKLMYLGGCSKSCLRFLLFVTYSENILLSVSKLNCSFIIVLLMPVWTYGIQLWGCQKIRYIFIYTTYSNFLILFVKLQILQSISQITLSYRL